MRKSITTIVSICALLLAGPLHWPRKVLDMIGTIQTGLGLPDISDPVISLIASYPGLTTDVLPVVLVASALTSLVLAHGWPNAVPDLLGRKRLDCKFDPAVSGCWMETPTWVTTVIRLRSTTETAMNAVATSTSSDMNLPIGMPGERRIYARILVKAGGRNDIGGCTATLRSISLLGGKPLPGSSGLALPFAPAELDNAETRDLRVGAEEWVDVFYLTENRVNLASKRKYLALDEQKLHMAPQKLLFAVRVMAPECAPQDTGILLDWTGDMRTSSASACRVPSKVG